MAPTVTQQQVLDALKSVRFPGLSRDIVSFGFVHDLKIEDGNVRLTIRFQTENPAVGLGQFQEDIDQIRFLSPR